MSIESNRMRALLWMLALALGESTTAQERVAGEPDADATAAEAGGRTSGTDARLAAAAALQTVEVTGRRLQQAFTDTTFSTTLIETRLLEIPQSISAVTKETIQDQNLMQLNDIAPFVAGVNEFSVYDDLTIRGFRSSDDRRVNGLRTYNGFWSQPYIAHLERIEVIKGPAAVTFGEATPGGVINLVTKKPLTETRHELAATLGSFRHRYAALDSTGPLDAARTLPYRLNLSAWDTESFRNQGFDAGYSIAPSLSWLRGERTRVNLDVVHTDRRSVLDRGQPNVQGAERLGIVPSEIMVTQPGDRLDTESLSVALSGEHGLGERWSVAASLMHYAYDEQLIEHRIRNYLAPSVLRLMYIDRDTEATVDSGTLYLAGRLDTGPLRHRLVIGADALARDTVSDERFTNEAGTFDLLDPAYVERDPSAYALVPRTYGGRLDAHAGFIQDQISWGAWDFMAGLRYTRFTDRTIGAPEETHDSLVPRLGAVYRLSPGASLYGTWVRGFEAQFGYSTAEGGPFGPTRSELREIGYKQLAFDGRLLLTASLYQLTNDDLVIYANDASNPELYRQVGQERARGFELEALGRLGPRLQLIANYTLNDAEITRDADPALVGRIKENAPRHAGTLSARYDLPWGLGFGAGVTFVDERATFERALRLPSYTLLNAAVYYSRGGLQVSLQGRNLTDETHWSGGYNFGRVFPGDPRTLTLSVRYRL